ncbi:MAG: hypothetical protein ACMUIL_00810 [bacterium]
MSRLLKPITITDHRFLIKVFAECLDEWDDWKVLDQELGSPQRGTIDILAADTEQRPYLVTIGYINIEEGLIRCLTGYRWFKENLTILKRVFSRQEIDFDLPVNLVLIAEQVIPEASRLAQDISKVPISIFRYTCFGSKDDPLIHLEQLDGQPLPPTGKGPSKTEDTPVEKKGLNIDEIKRRLKVELADLSEKEIEEFLNLDLP